MKRVNLILFILVLSLNSLSIYSQIEMKYKDGRTFYSYQPILQNDTCLFSLKENLKADWSLFIELKGGSIHEAKKTLEKTSFEFNVDDCNIHWVQAAKFTHPNDHNTYYKGFIVCNYKGGHDSETIPLLFNLAPSKPILLEKEFKYDAFTEEGFQFFNTVCHFKIYTERVYTEGRQLICSHTAFFPSDWEWEHRHFCIADYTSVIPNKENTYEIDSNWGWRQLITVIARNKYGFSQNSDTLFTCDFITDQKILDAWKKLTSIIAPNEQEIKISVENGTLYINENVQQICIYNLSGQVELQRKKVDSVDLSFLSSGFYLVLVETSEKRIIKKIKL